MYDAIIVGARCAGSATGMLLARKGYRVLVVDRATFPSDTISSHWVHEPAVAKLRDWGLLDEVLATGCPPLENVTFDVGPLAISGRPVPDGDIDFSLCPRRIVLDKVLVDAAVKAGAEVREGFPAMQIVIEDGRAVGIRGRDGSVERARIVIGADGLNSLVARTAEAPIYNDRGAQACTYYTYWRDLPADGVEIYSRLGQGGAILPTNDGLTLLVIGWTIDQFKTVRRDIEGNYLGTARGWSASVASRLDKATRAARFVGKASLPNFYRKPHGPGWALVGDASYYKDPITAQGITDAFRDATLLAEAIDDGMTFGNMEDALHRYQILRDQASLPMFEFTADLAAMQPPTPEQQQLFASLVGKQDHIDRFLGVIAGTVPVSEFFSPENLGRVIEPAA